MKPNTFPRLKRIALLILAMAMLLAVPVRADNPPTQEDVFRSISSNVDQPTDGRKVAAVMIAIVGGMVLLVVFSRRQKRAAMPQKLNHPNKLLKELMKTAGLSRAQAKALRARAEEFAAAGRPLQSPITLLLCPSLLEKKNQNA